jgi:hypothetical protein
MFQKPKNSCAEYNRLVDEVNKRYAESLLAGEQSSQNPKGSPAYEQKRADARMARRRLSHANKQKNFHPLEHGCRPIPQN